MEVQANQTVDTKDYRVAKRFKILNVLVVVAVAGLVATWILQHYFGN